MLTKRLIHKQNFNFYVQKNAVYGNCTFFFYKVLITFIQKS